MTRRQHGFDVVGATKWFENWCVDHFACPVGGPSPGGKSEAIRLFPEGHWSEHGVHRVVWRDGIMVSAPRCDDAPCPVLGVALALLEIHLHDVTVVELAEVEWLQAAERRFSISESTRASYLEEARQLAAGLISRAISSRGLGRPKRVLAQLVAQHLWSGGFSHGQIATIMNSSIEATRRRC
jgi:hypothetical protein